MIRALFASLLLCSPVLADECCPRPPVVIQAPDARFIGPNLPCFTKHLSDNDFKWWVIEQNEIAYQAAAARRDTNPGTFIQEKHVNGWSAGRFSGGWNNVTTRETQTFAPGATPYGGGPVWIHNPFVRQ